MKRPFGSTVALTLVAAAALPFSSPGIAAPMSVRTLAAQQMHLATIAYRIGTSNVGQCRGQEMVSGIIAHDLTQYDPGVRPAISRAFSLSNGFGVLEVVTGSAAARAGLRVDDEILRIGNSDVQGRTGDNQSKSYRRMQHFKSALNTALAMGPTTLLIRREGALQNIELEGEATCGGDFALINSVERNAWSDGTHVLVTTGMASLARSDDEIAFVIAHEMAHNMLGHSKLSKRRNGIFGSLSEGKRSEMEADQMAVRLMIEAGYRPEGGISFLQTVSKRLWWAISLDHPGFAQRMKIVTAAMSALPALAPYPRTPKAALNSPYSPPNSGRLAALEPTVVPATFSREIRDEGDQHRAAVAARAFKAFGRGRTNCELRRG